MAERAQRSHTRLMLTEIEKVVRDHGLPINVDLLQLALANKGIKRVCEFVYIIYTKRIIKNIFIN
jgi:hypothetical protein